MTPAHKPSNKDLSKQVSSIERSVVSKVAENAEHTNDSIETLSDRTRANTILLNSLSSDMKLLQANTAGIIETFDALSGGFKVLTAIGKLARPIGWIAGAVAALIALWAAIHGGGK